MWSLHDSSDIVTVVSNNSRWPTNGPQCGLWYDRWMTVIAQKTHPSRSQTMEAFFRTENLEKAKNCAN